MIMLCGHCRNKTSLVSRGEYEHKKRVWDIEKEKYVTRTISWEVFECVTCSKPTLIEDDMVLDSADLPELLNEIVLYPSVDTPLTNLPEKIEKAYAAAIKVKNIEPNACAVLVGRTLEAACNHEEAQGT